MAEVTDGRFAAAGDRASEAELTWVSHPLRHAHQKTLLLIAVVSATSFLIGFNTGSIMWGVISTAILLLGVYEGGWLPLSARVVRIEKGRRSPRWFTGWG